MSKNFHEWVGKIVAPAASDPTSPLDEFHDWAASWMCGSNDANTEQPTKIANPDTVKVEAQQNSFQAVELAPTLPTPVVTPSQPPIAVTPTQPPMAVTPSQPPMAVTPSQPPAPQPIVTPQPIQCMASPQGFAPRVSVVTPTQVVQTPTDAPQPNA